MELVAADKKPEDVKRIMPRNAPKRELREAAAAKADVEERLVQIAPVAVDKDLPGSPWGIRVSKADGATAFLAYGSTANRAWIHAKQRLDEYGTNSILRLAGYTE